MIITSRNYLESLLTEIGIPKIFFKLIDIESAMKPALWAVIENPDPEEYTESRARELFVDKDKKRTYHIKDYDVSAVLTVRIGAKKDEIANSYKRAFIENIVRCIEDFKGYRITITLVNGDLNPSDYELTDAPHVLIKVRFSGGLWRLENTPLIEKVVPEGEIVKNNELEEV